MSKRRAVILGGGGVTGIAWETGLLMGLQDAGVELDAADAIIGTSAGSFVGAYLAARVVPEYFTRQFEDNTIEIPATMSSQLYSQYQQAMTEGNGDPAQIGRCLGRIALNAATVSTEARAAVVASRLPGTDWPKGALQMTALDAETGALHLFDHGSGVPFVTAAAASGAVPGLWPVVDALGRKWIDGGSASATNAGLGASYDTVIVIAPAGQGFPGQIGTGDDVAKLRAAGTTVVLIVPDADSARAIGDNGFDPTRRGLAAEAGRRQGQATAPEVCQHWRLPASAAGLDGRR